MSDNPLIYDFIEKKKNTSEQIKFDYSDKHDLNVVQFNGETIPFVQLARDEKALSKLYELRTKTFEEREKEEEPEESCLLELLTKTRQDREDEEDKTLISNGLLRKESEKFPKHARILELYTKTEEKSESDEERVYATQFLNNLFELFTKTKEERESEEDSESTLRYDNTLFDLI